MSAEIDFTALRSKLRAKCVYLADDNLLERVEWLEMQDFDRVVTKNDADKYREAGAPSGEPPPPACLAGIFRLTHRNAFFMRACGRWKPNTSPCQPPFAGIRPSAFTEDPGIPELEDDYPKGWNNIAELLREWYRSQGKNETKVTDSRGVINWTTKSEPNPAHGFKIGHRVFEKRTPESLEIFEDHGPNFSIENWPVEFPEAQDELNKIMDTHIARPIPVYYPEPDNTLIPPDRYWDDLRGAVVRLEFHLNHWYIDDKHIFTADIMRMKVLIRPSLPPPRSKKRKGNPLRGDVLDKERRSTKRQAVSRRTETDVPQRNLQAGNSTPKRTKVASRGLGNTVIKEEETETGRGQVF